MVTAASHLCQLGGRTLDPPTDWSDQSILDDFEREVSTWLATIVRSDHLALLVGSGLTTAAALGVGAEPLTMKATDFRGPEHGDKALEHSTRLARRSGRHQPNIEDQIRTAVMLRDGLAVLGDSQASAWNEWLKTTLSRFSSGVLEVERRIRAAATDSSVESTKRFHPEASDGRRDATATQRTDVMRDLVAFLLAFAYRAPARERLHLFTTNYDRLLEHLADLAGLRMMDRFVGVLEPRFRSSRLHLDIHYNPPGIRGEPRYLEGVVRFTKLHGSVDWAAQDYYIGRVPAPFGCTAKLHAELIGDASQLLIYPNAAKDVETSLYPYADLFRDFSAAIVRPNSVLVTYGYGFGDAHVNRVIADMLVLPSTHLVVISYNAADGRIDAFLDGVARPDQVSRLIGPRLAGLGDLVVRYLPHPSLDHFEKERFRLLTERGGVMQRDQDDEQEGDAVEK